MSHSDKGLKQILRLPLFYHSLQVLVGNKKVWKRIATNYLKPHKRMKILDIGCGTSGILEYIHGYEVQYYGYDFNNKYIEDSKKKWGALGEYFFECKSSNDIGTTEYGSFDAILSINLLHHLSDEDFLNFVDKSHKLLKPNGKLITSDPCRFQKMSLFEKFMIKHDRGRDIRTLEGYKTYFSDLFVVSLEEVGIFGNIPQRGVFFLLEKVKDEKIRKHKCSVSR
jgi:SAM-dependent methyltransferase